MTAPDFATWQAICEVKARYCRCLDTKDWAGYADVFTEDAVIDTTKAGGPLMEGREALLAFLQASLADAATAHQVHSPEIAMTGLDSAEAVFAMQDRVVFPRAKARGNRHGRADGLRPLSRGLSPLRGWPVAYRPKRTDPVACGF